MASINSDETTPLRPRSRSRALSITESITHTPVAGEESKHVTKVGGDKNISFAGGIALLTNNITGPGIVALPLLFQQAGWLTPLLTMILITVVGSLAATMLCEAMARVPGNDKFQKRFEICTLARIYMPRWAYWVTVILLVMSLAAPLIVSIVISAQTMDQAIFAIFHRAPAFEFFPHPGFVLKHHIPSSSDSPFGSDYVLSPGFLIVMFISVPLGYLNLDDNIWVQFASFIFLAITTVFWCMAFSLQGLDMSRVPVVGPHQASVLGTIIFNYAFVTSVPSWVNEKKPHVNVNSSIWFSSWFATLIFVVLGWLGGLAFDIGSGQDLLDVIATDSHGAVHVVSLVLVYLFPLFVLLSSIPIFSIVIKYNLIENDIAPPWLAGLVSIVLPWLIAIPAYTGSYFVTILNWTSLLFTGFANFTVPYLLYGYAKRHTQHEARRVHEELGEGLQDPGQVDVINDTTALIYRARPPMTEAEAELLASAYVREAIHGHFTPGIHRALPQWLPISHTKSGLLLASSVTLLCIGVIIFSIVEAILHKSLSNP